MSTSKLDEYRKMRHDIAEINPNRGGSPNQSKGFYAEVINASENNIERIEKDIKARVIVVDNNGVSDAIITYVNGQTGREIQDKVGYTYYQLKQMIDSGKYDGMIFTINKDHTVFSNSKQIDALNEIAKKRNIKIVSSDVSEEEVVALAKTAAKEVQIRKTFGIDDNKAPVTATGYTAKKVIDDSIKDTKNFISEQTGRFMSENFKAIHAAGVDEAINSAMFAATFSTVKNIHSVIKGEESGKEAIKEILFDTSSAAALGYATGAVMEKFNIGARGDAALLVNGMIQISKQVFAYVNGNIDEQQLLNNIAETTVHLAAAYVGRIIGSQLIPIPIVGSYIGEMITTAICSEVISTIKDTKEFEKQNQKYISLYRRAEQEIRLSNERLTAIIESENNELKRILQDGFTEIHNGINENSYDLIMNGLAKIGSKFGMKDEDFKKNLVTRENLFKNTDNIRIIGKEN